MQCAVTGRPSRSRSPGLGGSGQPRAFAPTAQAFGPARRSRLTVDVYVNGERTLNNFKPGTLAGPLNLDAGTYEVAITAADAEDDSDPAIGPIDLKLKAGENYTAVAHLEEGGDPTATLFTNDTCKTDAGQGRLTVRHTAAAPAVDILAGGDAVISDLSNPDEEVLDLDAGTVEASVAAAGTTDPVIGPADVTVAEGKNTIVYAWGSLDDDNLKLAVQTISGLHSPPHGVNAGEAGLAADRTGPATCWPRCCSAAARSLAGRSVQLRAAERR